MAGSNFLIFFVFFTLLQAASASKKVHHISLRAGDTEKIVIGGESAEQHRGSGSYSLVIVSGSRGSRGSGDFVEDAESMSESSSYSSSSSSSASESSSSKKSKDGVEREETTIERRTKIFKDGGVGEDEDNEESSASSTLVRSKSGGKSHKSGNQRGGRYGDIAIDMDVKGGRRSRSRLSSWQKRHMRRARNQRGGQSAGLRNLDIIIDVWDTEDSKGACGGEGWTEFQHHCYKMVSGTGFNFDEAQRACEAEGANLASIHSLQENNFVGTLTAPFEFKNYKFSTTSGFVKAVWIGMRRKPVGGGKYSLTWLDKTPVNYGYEETNGGGRYPWWKGNPDTYEGDEECVTMFPIYSYDGLAKHELAGYGTQWNDMNCARKLQAGICKKVALSQCDDDGDDGDDYA